MQWFVLTLKYFSRIDWSANLLSSSCVVCVVITQKCHLRWFALPGTQLKYFQVKTIYSSRVPVTPRYKCWLHPFEEESYLQ